MGASAVVLRITTPRAPRAALAHIASFARPTSPCGESPPASQGTDFNHAGLENGLTPLLYATQINSLAGARFALKHGADPAHLTDGKSPLLVAAQVRTVCSTTQTTMDAFARALTLTRRCLGAPSI